MAEVWFETGDRWRSTLRSQNIFPNLVGNYEVVNGKRFGTYSSEDDTFTIRPTAALDDPYTQSGLGIHDPTIGEWATNTGLKTTEEFLNENCKVTDDAVAGRAADQLDCETGLEGDTLRKATIWLDRETGFILKLQTFSCGTVEGERRCGVEAVRETTSIEFDPAFPDGIFDVKFPAGATVREEPAPRRSDSNDPIAVEMDPSRIRTTLGAVWIGGAAPGVTGRLQRIDPARNAVVAGFDDVALFDVDERFVWVVNARTSGATLRRIDIDTNRFAGPEAPLGTVSPQDIAVGEGAVWVAGVARSARPEAGELLKIDPSSGEITRIKIEGAPAAITVGGGAAWVQVTFQSTDGSASPTHSIVKVNARTGRVESALDTDGPFSATFGEGSLWTLSRGGGTVARLTKIDPGSMQSVATIDLQRDRSEAILAAAFGFVWVVNADAATATTIDPVQVKIAGEPTRFDGEGARVFAIGDGGRTPWVGLRVAIGLGSLIRMPRP